MLKLMTFRTFPRTTGSDFSGEIIAKGESVNNFEIGEKVFGFLSQLNEKSAISINILYFFILTNFNLLNLQVKFLIIFVLQQQIPLVVYLIHLY